MDTIVDIIIIMLFTAWIANALRIGWSPTDDKVREKSSGLVLYTDYGTGVQYVGTIFGSITPRLDSKGKPVCIKKPDLN